MEAPDVSYARSGDISLAYVVTGTGSIDLVFVHGFVGNLDTAWEQPLRVAFFERLGSFARVIEFDRRGTGLSDRVREVPTLETRTDDLRAVMDAAEVGDRQWAELVGSHHALVRRQLDRFRGVSSTRPGTGSSRASTDRRGRSGCARAISESVRELALEVRAGLHTGECEVIGEKLGGIAVNIGARVAARAQPVEVLVSSTVRDLVAGSGIAFEDRGIVELKGVPGSRQLYAVA